VAHLLPWLLPWLSSAALFILVRFSDDCRFIFIRLVFVSLLIVIELIIVPISRWHRTNP